MQQKSERPDLTSANVVVSGGRALKSKENFKIIEDLADKLGAAGNRSCTLTKEGPPTDPSNFVQWALRVLPSTLVTLPTTGRWVRRARLSLLSSTLPSAFPVRPSFACWRFAAIDAQLPWARVTPGQIQHLAGMKDSKLIVAINNAPDAPIFQVCRASTLTPSPVTCDLFYCLRAGVGLRARAGPLPGHPRDDEGARQAQVTLWSCLFPFFRTYFENIQNFVYFVYPGKNRRPQETLPISISRSDIAPWRPCRCSIPRPSSPPVIRRSQ